MSSGHVISIYSSLENEGAGHKRESDEKASSLVRRSLVASRVVCHGVHCIEDEKQIRWLYFILVERARNLREENDAL